MMILPVLLLLNNCILFIVEVIGYHACHSGNSNCYEEKKK